MFSLFLKIGPYFNKYFYLKSLPLFLDHVHIGTERYVERSRKQHFTGGMIHSCAH